MTTAMSRPITQAVDANWRTRAACRDQDPDMFFPEKNTTPAEIQAAKAICGRCPVREACLDEAFRMDDRVGICGGLTPDERRQLLDADFTTPEQPSRFQGYRAENRSARTVAMTRGADMVMWLVKYEHPVEHVAQMLQTAPRAVYQAWRMVVPAAGQRKGNPSAVERLLAESSLLLRELAKMGRSHEQIAVTLATSQNVVSASLRVLAQRDAALDRMTRRGMSPDRAMGRMQAAEARVRRESGHGLTVEEVVESEGVRIWCMHAEGMSLKQVAEELKLCRETVRLAYHVMLRNPRGVKLSQNQMEKVA